MIVILSSRCLRMNLAADKLLEQLPHLEFIALISLHLLIYLFLHNALGVGIFFYTFPILIRTMQSIINFKAQY